MAKYYKGPVNTLTRDTCLYLAGLFDGEGSFQIHLTQHRGELKINARVRIAMTDLPTMEWVAKAIGRPVRAHGLSAKVRDRAKAIHRVSVENIDGIISLTEQLLPFLITKRRAAETVLAFCRSRLGDTGTVQNRRPYTMNEIQLHSTLREINRIGLVQH